MARGFFALVLVLTGGELVTRLLITSPSPHEFDPEIGYGYRPHSDLFQTKEGVSRLRFNSLGLNDQDLTPVNGRCRVLVIGDSYTAALQVPQAQNFTSIAEHLDGKLDVVNGGRDGLFLGDLHKVSSRLAKETKPDLVVYVLSKRAVDDDIHLPGFSVTVDPATGVVNDAVMGVESKEFFKQTFAPILRESALATRLAAQLQPTMTDTLRQIRAVADWIKPRPVGDSSRAGPTPAPASDDDVLAFVFARLGTGGTPVALLYLDALNLLPNRQAVVAPPSRKAEVVARWAASRAAVRFFNTSDYLIASVKQTGQPPYGFDNAVRPGGHLNPGGHQAVGRALVDLVRDMSPALPAECSAK